MPLTAKSVFTDIHIIGHIFNVDDRASALIEGFQDRLELASENNASNCRTAFIFDSAEETPYSIGYRALLRYGDLYAQRATLCQRVDGDPPDTREHAHSFPRDRSA
ncbi:hypothetical protein ACFE33_15320 (plasmid) [Falsihalocynthiibacter sp. SS001]|uniref:hypothetical protein n=1 Tax=Falsihalocynthiibacter sp. SS001 TaxID=3349698 RepID=UPI0036D3370F